MDQEIEDILGALATQGRLLDDQVQAIRRYLEHRPEEVRRMMIYVESGNWAALLELLDLAYQDQ